MTRARESSSVHPDEEELVALLRAGDEEAFATMVERHHAAMVRVTRNYVHSRAVAEEVAQETWLAVLRGIDRFEVRSPLRAWLFRIVVNRATTAGVREGVHLPVEDHELEVNNDITTNYYTGLRRIPAFVPDMHPVPSAVRELLSQMTDADAVMFSTPEHAGGLPGALKNLLDWKPAAWIDVANPGRGQGARAQLQTVLGYVGAHLITPACVHVTLHRVDGAVTLGEPARQELATAVAALVAAAEEDT